MKGLHFDARRPAEGDLFVNRAAELRRLVVALDKLQAGRADYLCVLERRHIRDVLGSEKTKGQKT